MLKKGIVILVTVFYCSISINLGAQDGIHFSQLQQINPDDSQETIIAKAAHVIPSSVQLAYHRNEFIGMICFGPNTYTGREWGTGMEDPTLFNPADMNTDQWCASMKTAGITLVVFVAKHHDGYCLWQTRYTEHGVMSSQWEGGQGDVLRELSESCVKFNLKLGVYLSPADLYQIESPDGLYGNQSEYYERIIPRPTQGRPFRDKRSFRFVVDDYNEYFLNQLFELLTEYGPIHEVWFDGAHPKRKGNQQYTYEHWYTLIRELAPEAVIFGKGPDVRWCGNERGRTRESEWNVIPLDVHPDNCDWPDIAAEDLGSREKLYDAKYLYYLPAETNTSIRHGWFYRDDTLQDVRTADDVFDIYERSIGGNSVFMLNIPPNRDGQFSKRDVNVLKEVGKRIRETYGHSLLKGAVSNSTFVLDGYEHTYWSPEKEDENLVLTLDEPVTVNRFVIHEAIGLKGQRIEQHALDAWIDNQWKEVALGTTVGYKKILRFPQITSNQFRLRIPVSRLKPSVVGISAHYYRPRPGTLQIQRDLQGLVSIVPQVKAFEWKPHHQNTALINQDLEICYTIDGSEPDRNSATYRREFPLRSGGVVKACAFSGDESGPVVVERFGLFKGKWKLLSVSSQQRDNHPASNAFDDNPVTFWISGETGETLEPIAHPHFISIDLDSVFTITGFMYLPRQDRRTPDGMIEKGYIEISEDGKNWYIIENFEFGNLLNDPSRQTCWFREPVKSRYVRLTSTAGVNGNPLAGAAEIDVLTK